MFDWRRFLTNHGIDFVTSGPNVRSGNINVRCPWCGAADPSEHMGISLKGLGWGCWRNKEHRGKSRAKLIMALLNCDWAEACRLAGTPASVSLLSDDRFGDVVAERMGLSLDKPDSARMLEFPVEFKPLSCGAVSSTPFIEYLKGRGYDGSTGSWIADNYRLRYALRGDYAYRLIVPVYDQRDVLVTWTGRSIRKYEPVRYRTLPMQAKYGVSALAPPASTLLGINMLQRCSNPDLLVVTEGPFDAMRVSALGRSAGVWGTCLFGLNISDQQISLLWELSQRFNRIGLLLDAGTELDRFRICERIGLPLDVLSLPGGIKDAAELKTEVAVAVLAAWRRSTYDSKRRRVSR